MEEPIKIESKIKKVVAEESPKLSKPKVITWKKPSISKTGNKKRKAANNKQPTGKKTMVTYN